MGQSSSTPVSTHRHPTPPTNSSTHHHHRPTSRSEIFYSMTGPDYDDDDDDDYGKSNIIIGTLDYISDLPDECLASIFHFLTSGDRKNASLVSKRWLRIEGQSRHRLSLHAHSDLLPHIPALLSRFDAVTKLALRCDRRSVSLDDDALALISLRCPHLTRLKLRACRELTDAGMASFAQNCRSLKKFSCGSCNFGVKGMNAVLKHCALLEELSVKRLRGVNDAVESPISPGLAASSLKTICLKELYNGPSFGPLIASAKNLKTLKLLRCLGDWDRVLENIANGKNSLITEVHLERLQVTDAGLKALSSFPDLEILHLVKTPECTNTGIVCIAEHCKLLRKLHIDGWRTNRIGNEGLTSIGKHCGNLQELVLIGVNLSAVSLEVVAANCLRLERLALCGSETIGDAEISCVASKCMALKKICIKGCPVTDQGIEAFAWGCPNLVKIKVKKCRGVTSELADWLKVRRGSLMVNLDVCEVEADGLDASASDGGVQEDGVEFPPIVISIGGGGGASAVVDIPSGSNGRPSVFRSRLGIFGGRSLVACAFRRWSNGGSSGSNDSSL